MPRILVVEDNLDYRELLENFLESAHYKVDAAADGQAALALVEENSFDLILLDLMLPSLDGFHVCKEIREICDTPVIMLTALGDEEHQIHGYRLQIDDYITKPVSMPLLLHKVESVLRRTMPSAPETLCFGGISLDLKAYTACVDGEPVNFTLREFEILQELMQEPDAVVTRKSLIAKLWGYDFYGDARIVDTHIKNIRKKLGKADCIETVRGVGYKLLRREF